METTKQNINTDSSIIETHMVGVDGNQTDPILTSSPAAPAPTSLVSSRIDQKTFFFVYTAVAVMFGLLLIFPAWYDRGGFGSSMAILMFGWLGILVGIPSWYWFVGAVVLVKSLRSGAYFNWGLVKKSAMALFFVACIAVAYGVIQIGNLAPMDIDCQCQYITALGVGYYVYLILVLYFLSLMFVCSYSETQLAPSRSIRVLSVLVVLICLAVVAIKFSLL